MKSKTEETKTTTRNDFFMKTITLNVALKIAISTRHFILLIGTICNGNLYEWIHITVINIK